MECRTCKYWLTRVSFGERERLFCKCEYLSTGESDMNGGHFLMNVVDESTGYCDASHDILTRQDFYCAAYEVKA